MPREQVVAGLITGKLASSGPDVAIRRFAGLTAEAAAAAGQISTDAHNLLNGNIQVSVDVEEAKSIIAAADEDARKIGNQYLGAGDLSLAKTGDGINVHVAVQAWPQSALAFLAQLHQAKITTFQRQPLMLFETWQNMIAAHQVVHAKVKETLQALERERAHTAAILEDEMNQAAQRSVDASASVTDLRNCQNNITRLMTELQEKNRQVSKQWTDSRLAIVSQAKLYFETMAAQHKSGLTHIEAKAQQHKFTVMPKLTKSWRDGARSYFDLITNAIRQRLLPVLTNNHYREQLNIIIQQNFADQPGLTLNTLVMCCSEILKVNPQTYRLQASAVWLPQAMRMSALSSPDAGYEHIDVAATRQATLFQAGGSLIQQWCHLSKSLQQNEAAAELIFRAAVMLSVLIDEAESVDTAIASFHETDCARGMQRVTAHRDQSISVALEKFVASVDAIDQASAENSELASKQRKLSEWGDTWRKLRNEMPAEVAALSPSQNRWYRLVTEEHKARLNEIIINSDVTSAEKILQMLKSGGV